MPRHEWMRQKEADILSYLPYFLQKDSRFKAANTADSQEHDVIRLMLQELIDQCYVSTATWGLDSWEELVGVKPYEGMSLATRRAVILQKLGKPPSVTRAFLEQIVNQYVAGKSGIVIDHPENYSIEIDIPLLDKNNIAAMARDIRTYIPAHIGALYKAVTSAKAGNNIAMLQTATKTINIYPAAVEQVSPESSLYIAMAMSLTDEITLEIGGI